MSRCHSIRCTCEWCTERDDAEFARVSDNLMFTGICFAVAVIYLMWRWYS